MATPSLQALLDGARTAWPPIALSEDFYPADPRLVAHYELGSDRYRVHPGHLENILGQLDGFMIRARACDPVVRDACGFGLIDLIELALRYVDIGMRAFSAVWSTAERPLPELGFDDPDRFLLADQIADLPATVSDEEVAVASDARRWLEEAVQGCAHPDAGARALDWMTFEAADALERASADPGHWRIGPALLITSGTGSWPVPISCVFEGVLEAEASILDHLSSQDELSARLTAASVPVIDRILSGVELAGPGPDDDAGREDAQHQADATGVETDGNEWFVQPFTLVRPIAERHAVSIDLVPSARLAGLDTACEDALERAGSRSPASFRAGGVPIADECQLIPLVIGTGPIRLARPHAQGSPVLLSLDDLILLVSEAARGESAIDEVWRFLIDLTAPGPATPLSPDLMAAWRFWRANAGLLPADVGPVGDVDVIQPWSLHDETWPEAARWEPIDAALHAVHLPASRHFAMAHLDDDAELDGCATLMPPGPATLYLVAAPRLVVLAGIEDLPPDADPDGAPGLHRASGELSADLARSIRDLLVELGVVAALTEPVRLIVYLVPEGTHWTSDFVGVRQVHLAIGLDWVLSTSTDPTDAHAGLGACVIDALAASLTPKAAAAAADSWRARPPLLRAHLEQTGVPAAAYLSRRMPSGPHSVAAARRMLAAAIDRQLEPGQYVGRAALGLARDVLYPAARGVIFETSRRYERAALTASALRELDARLADIARDRATTAINLAGPWRDSTRAKALLRDEETLTRQALAAVIEFALASSELPTSLHETEPTAHALIAEASEAPPRSVVDRFDLADLVALAEQATLIGIIANPADQADDHVVLVSPSGAIAIAPNEELDLEGRRDRDDDEPRSRRVDLRAWSQAVAEHGNRLTDVLPLGGGTADIGVYQPMGAHLPPRWRTLDAGFREHLGTSLDAITVVLRTAESMAERTGDVVTTTKASIIDACTTWAPSVDPRELLGALELLTLTREGLSRDGLRVWELERRRHRLLIRPIIDTGESLMTTSHVVATTRTLFIGSLVRGKLIWPDAPRVLQDLANRIRQQVTGSLEQLLAQALDRSRLASKTNITPEHAAEYGLVIRREIDALAIDLHRRRLWVIEAKDLGVPASRHAISAHVRRYVAEYVPAHQERIEAVRAQSRQAVRLVLADRDESCDDYEVVGIFVTRTPSPAAYTYSPALAFTVIDDLETVLSADEVPSPGHAAIGRWQWQPE